MPNRTTVGNTARRRVFLLLIVLIIAQTVFIFANSTLSIPDSKEASLGIAAFFKHLLDPKDVIDWETFHHYIRKLAHFTEFGVLGFLYSSAVSNRVRRFGGVHLFIALFASLFTAVCDEFLQFFTGRGSMVTDVMLDFSGAVCGIIFAGLIIHLFTHLFSKRKESPS